MLIVYIDVKFEPLLVLLLIYIYTPSPAPQHTNKKHIIHIFVYQKS